MTSVPTRHNQTLVQWVMRRFTFDLSSFPEDVQHCLEIGDIDRVSGNAICSHCGSNYFDHPKIKGIEGVIVTCDWKVYKI